MQGPIFPASTKKASAMHDSWSVYFVKLVLMDGNHAALEHSDRKTGTLVLSSVPSLTQLTVSDGVIVAAVAT